MLRATTRGVHAHACFITCFLDVSIFSVRPSGQWRRNRPLPTDKIQGSEFELPRLLDDEVVKLAATSPLLSAAAPRRRCPPLGALPHLSLR